MECDEFLQRAAETYKQSVADAEKQRLEDIRRLFIELFPECDLACVKFFHWGVEIADKVDLLYYKPSKPSDSPYFYDCQRKVMDMADLGYIVLMSEEAERHCAEREELEEKAKRWWRRIA